MRRCERCETETRHEVRISIERTTDGEDVAPQNEKYARSPSRITVCLACGSETRQRRVQHD
uniref:DUF7835 family putative zinc beta-ribbon protein n=1 Tax=Halegenticoccus soli TaxID=1985678 RepID=UPI001E5E0831|nr:hypothetical protein [Halegenticoccus soli]